jgi:periplasmic divalent cation tolerance protein
MMGIIIIQVTYPNIDEANKSISTLLNKNLISSANTFPIKSTSKWTGEIKEVDEISVFLKTREENWEKVKSEVKEIHPYEIPCIIKIKAEANKAYEDWVKKQTK